MSPENFYESKMILKSDDELKNYIVNKDHFQEDAVLAAILELEKRAIEVEGIIKLKDELLDAKGLEEPTTFTQPETQTTSPYNELPELYSTRFIFIFGALFSVFGGGILMALNFMTLNNKKAARTTVLASLGYSVVLVFLFDALGVTNALISLSTSILGIYLLDQFIWKKENPTTIEHKEKSILKPLIIGVLIAIPLAYLMIISGNLPQ